MRRYSLVFLALSAVNIAWADVPVVDINSTAATSAPPAAVATIPSTPAVNTSGLSLDQRVTRLENILNNQSQLLGQINALQQQVQDLQGQVEVLSNANQQLQQQQLKFYKDLDQRLQVLESARSTPAASAIVASAATPAVPASTAVPAVAATTVAAVAPAVIASPGKALSETDAYQTAFNSLTSRQYPQAVQQFQDFLKQYPNSDYAPNAHYWLGELFLVQQKPDLASTEFNTIIKQYPQNPKVPDAMLKLAFISADKGDKASAIKQLQQIQKLYPGTTAANLAQTKLASLKS